MGRTKRTRDRKKQHDFIEASSVCEFVDLQKWLRLKRSHFKMFLFGIAGRGIVSKRPINAGDELVAIPLSCMMTINEAKASDISDVIIRLINKPQIALAVFLLYEKHKEKMSKYYDYIQVLPEKYDTLLYCDEIEIADLPVWIRTPVKNHLLDIQEYFTQVLEAIESCHCNHCGCHFKDIMDYDGFLWSWSTINTRGVYFQDESESESKSESLALAPFLDFFNHSNKADVEVILDYPRGVYALKTKIAFKKYEQIFIKYGTHSNLRLLIEYGFILEDLDQDVVEFSIEEVLNAVRSVSRQAGDISKLKYKFIRTNSLNVNLTKSVDEFSWNMNGLLYILFTQDSDLDKLLTKTYSSTWSNNEELLMNEAKEKILSCKSAELTKQLNAMLRVSECSSVFKAAIKLVEQYIEIVKG